MDFSISQDHQMLSDSLRRYFAAEYTIEKHNETAFAAPFHDSATWGDLAELGVIGAFVDEAHGGYGGSAEDIAIIFEEAGRALCSEPLLGTLMGLRLIAENGHNDIVEQIVSGEERAAFAVFVPGLACDVDGIEATAKKDGDEWTLHGTKIAAYGAPGAKHVVIAARTGGHIGLFLTDTPDMIATAMVDGGGTANIEMDGLPATCLTERGETQIADALDMGRIALCAEATGLMDRLLTMTIDYLKERKQFGQPLANFQALQHRVVDMVMEAEQSRSIVIRAASGFGTPDQARYTAMAKNLIGRAATKIGEEAIQLHGGIGMSWEYPGSHYAKRLIMIDHQLGDRHDHARRLSDMKSNAA